MKLLGHKYEDKVGKPCSRPTWRLSGMEFGESESKGKRVLFNSGRGSDPEAQPDSCSSSSAAKALSSCFRFVYLFCTDQMKNQKRNSHIRVFFVKRRKVGRKEHHSK